MRVISQPTPEEVREFVENLHPLDVEKVYMLRGDNNAFQAINQAVRLSEKSWLIRNDKDEPVLLFGVLTGDLLNRIGRPFFFTTSAKKSTRVIIEQAPKYICQMLDDFDVLENYAFAKSKGILRLLKLLGFEVGPVVKIGSMGGEFRKFWKRGE